jgi:uncharacterized membrane protein YcaP (DUF421 family)
MKMDIPELVTRIVLSFLILLTLTRSRGRLEISQTTFFTFVSAITIGTIGGSLVTNNILSIRNGVIALIGWSILTLAMELIDIKSKKARVLIEGQPIIVIKDGQIMEDSLRKARLDIDTLNAMLREKSAFSVSDVQYAIFETDGKLSVMKKEEKQSLTKSDMNISSVNVFPIPTAVIADGKVNSESLSKLNLDKEWLDQQLKQSGVETISEVFYAEVQKDGSLYVDKRSDTVH